MEERKDGRLGNLSPRFDELHGKGTAEATDGETALSDGKEDRTRGGRCVGAHFGSIVNEVAGDGHCYLRQLM